MKISSSLILFSFLSFAIPKLLAQQCGSQAQGKTCSGGLCCSQWGWCGSSDEYCGNGCQSGPCDLSLMDISHVINKEAFERMILILHGDTMPNIGGLGFDTYEAFITAAKSFPSFGNVGNIVTRKTEIATFLARTLHGIAGNKDWMTKKDAINYFKTAISFWMTPQSSKPSHHQLMIVNGNSTSPDSTRSAAGRLPSYGIVTYIINGGVDHDQSGKEYDRNIAERLSLFMKYADILGVDYEIII